MPFSPGQGVQGILNHQHGGRIDGRALEDAAVQLAGADLATFRAWLAMPGNTLLMVLFVIAMFHHLQLGLQVVVEDYVGGETAKVTTLIVIRLGTVFFGAASILAIFRVVFGGQS